jgi:hypothetical protein
MKTENNITIFGRLIIVGVTLLTIGVTASSLSSENDGEQICETISFVQAQQMIEDEWKQQLGGNPVVDACRNELMRIERILERQSDNLSKDRLAEKRQQLSSLHEKLQSDSDETLYIEIRRLKREIMLGDPTIDFSEILCIDNPYPEGSEPYHEIRSRTENTAVAGGRLLILKGLAPNVAVKTLAPTGSPSSFLRPDLSFDAKKVLFSMKDSQKPSFNIYETGTDGKNLRQITDSEYNDLDPIYAPDGGIIFSTSRCNHYLRCGGSNFRMFILARCDKDGKNIYFISANNESDYTPAFLPDGRILYTRWEYVDKSVLRIQSLWTVHPDGTDNNTYWGNQSRWPDLMMNARPIPNTDKVVFDAVGHHDIYTGPLGIVNCVEGTNYPDGVYNLIKHVPYGEIGNGPEVRYYNEDYSAPECYTSFQTAYPMSENLMLVSARKGKNTYSYYDEPETPYFSLFLMDFDGNMELLYKGRYNILYAQPVKPRPVPATIPSSVKWPGKMTATNQQAEYGILYSSDIYEGSDIPRGMVKSLRILEIEPQNWGDGRRNSYGELALYIDKKAFPVPEDYYMSGETAVSFLMDDATKRILGTVPVEENGSVCFNVPPVKSIYFQLLDKNGRALQTMRSFTHVMPGEIRGCTGCHETRQEAPSARSTIAKLRAPDKIKPPFWGDVSVSFPRFVQPVLDRNCTACHSGNKPGGNLDLTHRTEPGTLMSWPYVQLVSGHNFSNYQEQVEKGLAGTVFPYYAYPNKNVKYPTTETVIPPMTALSYKSKLLDIATLGKHHGVKVSPEEEMMLAAWIDALCPYLGREELMEIPDIKDEDYFNQSGYEKLSYKSLMHTAPIVHKEFMQDDFKSQDARVPKDEKGNHLPAFEVKDGKRVYYPEQSPRTVKPLIAD